MHRWTSQSLTGRWRANSPELRLPLPVQLPLRLQPPVQVREVRLELPPYCQRRFGNAREWPPSHARSDMGASVDDRGQLIGLERDLQAALRRAIEQLEPGMEIVDDGAERSVASGYRAWMPKSVAGPPPR